MRRANKLRYEIVYYYLNERKSARLLVEAWGLNSYSGTGHLGYALPAIARFEGSKSRPVRRLPSLTPEEHELIDGVMLTLKNHHPELFDPIFLRYVRRMPSKSIQKQLKLSPRSIIRRNEKGMVLVHNLLVMRYAKKFLGSEAERWINSHLITNVRYVTKRNKRS